MIILRPSSESSQLTYTKTNKIKRVSIQRSTILMVDLKRRIVYPVNFWTGAKEKYVADSDQTFIPLSVNQMNNLLEDTNFKKIESWKPII